MYLLNLSHMLERHMDFLRGACHVLEFIQEALREVQRPK